MPVAAFTTTFPITMAAFPMALPMVMPAEARVFAAAVKPSAMAPKNLSGQLRV